tara:strand:+ start:1180 stop:1629 length:450 start_codon:yes stop_codon:yes gene_type:complete
MKQLTIKGYEFKDLEEQAIINVCINIDINTPFEIEECGYSTFRDMDIKYSHVCGRDKYTFDTECIDKKGISYWGWGLAKEDCIISKHKCDDPKSKTKCKYVTVRENAYDIYQHDIEHGFTDIQDFCDMNNYLFDVKGNLINHLKEKKTL